MRVPRWDELQPALFSLRTAGSYAHFRVYCWQSRSECEAGGVAPEIRRSSKWDYEVMLDGEGGFRGVGRFSAEAW